MPLIYQHNINAETRLGVWQIAEPDSFFLERVPLKKEVSHPHKRLQHLAGRYLLPVLFEDFPLEAIRVADTRKPFLENEQYHFSISHCDDFAAAIVSSTQRVGIDVERITPRVERIRHKFVSDEEGLLLDASGQLANTPAIPGYGSLSQPALLTLLWSAKEVLFKWYGSGELDFKMHMRLNEMMTINEAGRLEQPFSFTRNGNVQLRVESMFIGPMVLSWTATGH